MSLAYHYSSNYTTHVYAVPAAQCAKAKPQSGRPAGGGGRGDRGGAELVAQHSAQMISASRASAHEQYCTSPVGRCAHRGRDDWHAHAFSSIQQDARIGRGLVAKLSAPYVPPGDAGPCCCGAGHAVAFSKAAASASPPSPRQLGSSRSSERTRPGHSRRPS